MSNSQSEKKTGAAILAIFKGLVFLFTGAWFAWGVKVFVLPPYDYSPGEPGDFFSALTIFCLAYVTYMQMRQMEVQARESSEASILRAYELLKPDLEGVSAQVVSKLLKSGVLTTDSSATDLKAKFVKDRSVYLRELHKWGEGVEIKQEFYEVAKHGEDLPKAKAACNRYLKLMGALVKNLEEDKSGAEVRCAIEATDVYEAKKVVEEIRKQLKSGQ